MSMENADFIAKALTIVHDQLVIERKQQKFNEVCAEILKDVSDYKTVTHIKNDEEFKLYLRMEQECFTSYFLYNYIDKHMQDINFIIHLAETGKGKTRIEMIVSLKTF